MVNKVDFSVRHDTPAGKEVKGRHLRRSRGGSTTSRGKGVPVAEINTHLKFLFMVVAVKPWLF
ncbi:MAG: hypothetical protein LRY73_00130, partial [Bacillus sp. (in: Bacteria)]|nr:hypothetical protein [Bacillus sp. (in: firmicutes)]